MQWLLEADVFGPGDAPLAAAAREAGHRVYTWQDEWWSSQGFPAVDDAPIVFHGSLDNAARIAAQAATQLNGLGRWTPGAYCQVAALRCSAWYPVAAPWLVHPEYQLSSVRELVARPHEVAGSLASADGRVFVRPDSPLKPFSGRVVALQGLRAGDLDHGFYYDDLDLGIVVAPLQVITREWRFVVVDRRVVAGCEYQASGRQGQEAAVETRVLEFAQLIATELEPPDPVYVLDLCEVAGELRLIELNPFSGADLYVCDQSAIVRAIGALLG